MSSVTISSSQASKIASAISHLQSAHPNTTTTISSHACDLSIREKLEENLTALLDFSTKTAKLDHVVFTAGDAVPSKPLADTSVEELLAGGSVRFLAPLVPGKLAPHYLNPASTSSITLTGGIVAHRPPKHWAAAAAYLSGIEGAVRGLAVDLAPIRVNGVRLGFVKTEMMAGAPEALVKAFEEFSLLDRVGTPEEAAEGYIFCIGCRFLTGTVMGVDGGRFLR